MLARGFPIDEFSHYSYLVRHGPMGMVDVLRSPHAVLARGEQVVLQAGSGHALGEVLARLTSLSIACPSIVRPASPTDLSAAALAQDSAPAWFRECQELADADGWPIAIIDVEPLLEPNRALIHYLGRQGLDTTPFQVAHARHLGRLVEFAPVPLDTEIPTSGCGSCGAKSESGGEPRGCGSHGGCSSCSIAGAARLGHGRRT